MIDNVPPEIAIPVSIILWIIVIIQWRRGRER